MKIKKLVFVVSVGLTSMILLAGPAAGQAANPSRIKVLLIDGQNNHRWIETTPVIKDILEKTDRFDVEVSTCPAGIPKKPKIKDEDKNDPAKLEAWNAELKEWEKGLEKAKKINAKEWLSWNPDFYNYDLVVSNYNGQRWPEQLEKNFENYMKEGGGLVIIHAADNSFSDWEEYNKMIGVGGWGGRNEKSGPMLRYRDSTWVKDFTPGKGGMHGKQHATYVINLKPEHPIMKGLPDKWMHVSDEIYSQLRGPAENVTVLAASYSDENLRGSGELEPGLMAIDYHEGRVFHTIYGHNVDQMRGLGFQLTLQRGAEWAARDEVTLPLPEQSLSQTVALMANSSDYEEDFITLFDGQDISAWMTETGDWSVEEGILVLNNKGDYNMVNSSYLWTRETFGDFVLELDFKVPDEAIYGLEKFKGEGRPGNSGVFIRVENTGDPVQTGIEIQVGTLAQGEELQNGSVGGLFNLVPPSANMYKPGEWNHYRITCKGSLVSVELNGKETASADLNNWVTERMNPDGSPNKFKRPLKDFARSGHIGLQDHGTPAFYRDIRIKKL